MTVLPTPKHVDRTEQAKAEGYAAGQKHAEVAARTCPPAEWTPEARTDWCEMLTWLSTNPYAPDQQPYTDATDEQNAHYARQWQLSFDAGKHAEQAEQRRQDTVR